MENKVERIGESERIMDLLDAHVVSRVAYRLGHDHDADGNCLVSEASEERIVTLAHAFMENEKIGHFIERIELAGRASLMSGLALGVPPKIVIKNLIIAVIVQTICAGYLEGLAIATDFVADNENEPSV